MTLVDLLRGPLLVPVVAAALWYLASMALVTRWLWSHYPPWLDAWASCAACSGSWLSAGVFALLWRLESWSYAGLSGLLGLVAAFLTGMVLTPLWAGALVTALGKTTPEIPETPK